MIVNKVKDLRKKRRIPQKNLAEGVQVSRQTIHAIESSKCIPSLELALKISRYFELTVEEIFSLFDGQDINKGPFIFHNEEEDASKSKDEFSAIPTFFSGTSEKK